MVTDSGPGKLGRMPGFWEKMLLAGIVVLVAVVVRFVVVAVLDRSVAALSRRAGGGDHADDDSRARQFVNRAATALASQRQRQRITTLGSLLRNVVNIVLMVLTLLTVLAIFGVPMGPLIASAGVGGVALGFGAQSLVKDYLSGIFMLTEDQFGVGDLVRIGDLTGTVQEVTLRVTKLRDGSGTVWYVRNGEVLTLGNVSQGYSSATVDVPVAIDEDPQRVQELLRGAVGTMADEPEFSAVLQENPQVLGISSMEGGTMTVQISLRTGPNQQWGPMRVVRERAQRALSEAGVRGPVLQPGLVDDSGGRDS